MVSGVSEGQQQRKAPLWQRMVIGARPRQTLARTAVLAVVCFVCFRYVLLPVRLQGGSMEPTYADGGFNLANAWTYRHGEPARGDIVVIAMAGRKAMYLKRVLAVPGDRVRFVEGALEVNGAVVPEPYVVFEGRWTTPLERLAAGEYFVAGDNRAMPREAHVMGVVTRDRIVGRLVF